MSVNDAIFVETARKLKDTVQQGRSFETAQVKVIGLDDIRRSAGNDWALIGDRVRANSLNFLQGCLSDNDLIIPAGDGFIVIFEDLPGRNFVTDSAMIQDLLNAFYLGDAATKTLHADVRHESVDPRGMVHMLSKHPAPEPDRRAVMPPNEVVYLPIWHVAKDAVTAYLATPVHGVRGERRYGYDAAWAQTGANSPADYLSLDMAIVSRMIDDAEQCLAGGFRCMVNYSVHASTMQNRQRRQTYLRHLYATPAHLRPYIIGKISEVEPGTPIVTLAEWVNLLRPVSNYITIQLHESDRALAGLDTTGAFCVSFCLSADQHSAEGRDFYAREIQRWAVTLKAQRLKFRIDNVTDSRLLTLAVSSGADFLSSDRFWPVVARPIGVLRFTREQLRLAITTAA